MAKKVIRLTEAKIAEMAVEVARRMMKEENGMWNDINKIVQRGDDDSQLTSEYGEQVFFANRLMDYKRDLEDIRMDTEYTEGNPEAFKQAWDYLIKCSNKQYRDNEELKSMMRVIKAYITQYAEYARRATDQRLQEPIRK